MAPAYAYDHKEATNPVSSGKGKPGKKGKLERIEITFADNGVIVECSHKPPANQSKQEMMGYDYDSRRTRDVFSGKTANADAADYIEEKLGAKDED